jgi:hypothetical protein
MATNYYTTSVWDGWTTSASSSTTTLTTTGYGDNVWYTWNNGSGTSANTATTATTSGSVWLTWVTDSSSGRSELRDRVYGDWSVPELTKEQKAEQKRQAEEAKKKEEERLKLEREREAKAKALLKMILDARQITQLEEKSCFELVSVKSGNRYRIRKGDCRNVEKINEEGKVLETLCFHPKDDYKEGRGRVHHYDTMAIQKLMLENEEDEARQIANIARVANG